MTEGPPRTPPGAPGLGGGMSMVQQHPVHPGFAQQTPPPHTVCKACSGSRMSAGSACGRCGGTGREPDKK